jgi:hypothetical protein
VDERAIAEGVAVKRLELLRLAATTTAMSLFKHVATESDKIVLSLTATPEQMGVFAVAANYGSLVSRMIFLPVEDNARLVFAKVSAAARGTISSADASSSSSFSSPEDNTRISNRTSTRISSRSKPSKAKTAASTEIETETGPDKSVTVTGEAAMNILASAMSGLVRIVLFLGLTIAVFGPPYVSVLVKLLLGSKWSETSEETARTLAVYCWYLLLLGLNGVTEGFLHASCASSQFSRVNLGLVLSSIAFAVSAGPLIGTFGPPGIVVANICSMAVRIAWNGVHISHCMGDPKKCMGIDVGTNSSTETETETNATDTRSRQRWRKTFMEWIDMFRNALFSSSVIVCVAVCHASSSRFASSSAETALMDMVKHVGLGAVAFAFFVAIAWKTQLGEFKKTYYFIKNL